MPTAFRVVYSLVVAILFLLFVILGTNTFYAVPEEPESPWEQFRFKEPYASLVECDSTGRCIDIKTGQEVSPEESARLREEQTRRDREYQQAVEQYERDFEEYVKEERAPYHRNVFIATSILGVAAVAVGLALFRRVEALPLGLLFCRLAVVIFGRVPAAEG